RSAPHGTASSRSTSASAGRYPSSPPSPSCSPTPRSWSPASRTPTRTRTGPTRACTWASSPGSASRRRSCCRTSPADLSGRPSARSAATTRPGSRHRAVSQPGGTMGSVQFADLAATSAAVAATPARKAKIELLAAALRGLDPEEIEAGTAFLCGELRQRQTGVGWAALRDLPPPADVATLTVADVDRAAAEIARVSGPGSQARRRELVHRLFAAATVPEQVLLRGLFGGEVRQGAAAGVLVEAVAAAAGVPAAAVRRALLVSGDLRRVARAALTSGVAALSGFTLRPGTPLSPMLAVSAPTAPEALEITGAPALVDTKLDGVRIQVHRDGDDVAVFSRSLDDITARMPEVARAVRALPVSRIVLD